MDVVIRPAAGYVLRGNNVAINLEVQSLHVMGAFVDRGTKLVDAWCQFVDAQSTVGKVSSQSWTLSFLVILALVLPDALAQLSNRGSVSGSSGAGPALDTTSLALSGVHSVASLPETVSMVAFWPCSFSMPSNHEGAMSVCPPLLAL